MLPVVLHHGLFGSGDIQLGPLKLRYFRGIDRAISERGHPLIVTHVHPCSSVENRARQLKESLLKQLHLLKHNDRVILIAHSMGGLDARFAISELGLAQHVAALVTITTPHRGSPFADWIMKNVGKRLRGIQLLRFLDLDFRALSDLTTRRCTRFNSETPDAPNVNYFSVSAAAERKFMPPFALLSQKIIAEAEGENDGLVSVASSKWGKHLGIWPVDHWHAINRNYRFDRRVSTQSIIPHWMKLLDEITAATSVHC